VPTVSVHKWVDIDDLVMELDAQWPTTKPKSMESQDIVTYCSVCGEKYYSAAAAALCPHVEKFATAYWTASDITSVAPSLSAEEAAGTRSASSKRRSKREDGGQGSNGRGAVREGGSEKKGMAQRGLIRVAWEGEQKVLCGNFPSLKDRRRQMSKLGWRIGMMAVVALGLGACSSTGSSPYSHSSPATSAASSSPGGASPVAGAGGTFQLVGEGTNPVAHGTITVVAGAGSFTLEVKMSGLQPHSYHPAHIHAGASCESNGAIAIALQTVVAGGSGNGNADVTTTIPQAYAVPSSGWYVNVHQGPDLTGAGATPIACAVLH
jgi:Cu/Zn superoxide dismutase